MNIVGALHEAPAPGDNGKWCRFFVGADDPAAMNAEG